MRRFGIGVALTCGLIVGPAVSCDSGDQSSCAPGAVMICACAGFGMVGAQQCRDDGLYGACDCGDASSDAPGDGGLCSGDAGCACESGWDCQSNQCIDGVCRDPCGPDFPDFSCPQGLCCLVVDQWQTWAMCMPPPYCSAPACTPYNCEGCCLGDVCLSGATDSACGYAGQQCSSCSGYFKCVDRACVDVGTCVSDCHGATCGADECGRSCGECAQGASCYQGRCWV
jgi:hypothetical protein